MINNEEKLNKISYMVMREANIMKDSIIKEAEEERSKAIAEKEIEFLENAYELIQSSLERNEKDSNQEVSDAIIMNKRALLNRREELVEKIFSDVRERLQEFRARDEYKDYLINLLEEGLSKTGSDEVCILAGSEDFPLIEAIQSKLNLFFDLTESEEELLGGCLIQNKTKGLMYDYSFKGHLAVERASFLEKYELPIEK